MANWSKMPDRFTRGVPGGINRHKGKRMGTLWLNIEEGTGDVTLVAEIDDDIVLRADLLADWSAMLKREYDLAMQEWETSRRKKYSNVVQFPDGGSYD